MNGFSSEYRFDPLRGDWVIVAPGRAQRPQGVRSIGPWLEPKPCPFCPGNESHTPPEILALRPDGSAADTPGWQVRVVPNKYPAVLLGDAHAGGAHPANETRSPIETGQRAAGYGSHEAVIETPDHEVTMANRTVGSLRLTLKVYRERLRALREDHRLRHVQIFKNSGYAAGATHQHPHSQILATSTLPRAVASELRAFEEYRRRYRQCIICERITRELDEGDRIIHREERYVSFCPYASRLPFETCIAPIAHSRDYAESSEEDLLELAGILKRTVGSIARAVENPAFNLVLHTTPNAADMHWRFELLPRLTNLGGFEWGAGMYINHLPPEEAAGKLRRA